MAATERSVKSVGLKIETSFHHGHRTRWRGERGGREGADDGRGNEGDRTNIFHDYDTRRCGTDEDHSVLSSLYSSTPPISVPRHDDHLRQDVDYPHKPKDIKASPLDSFLQEDRSSLDLDPPITLTPGRQHSVEEEFSESERMARVQRFQPKSSSLRNTLPRDDKVASGMNQLGPSPSPRRYRVQKGVSTQYSRDSFSESSNEAVIDRPTSLTSVSTASAVTEELQTPPETSRSMLLSPICMLSPEQTYGSPEDRSNSWSGVSATPFGRKSRGYRSYNRQQSRRSTMSSGKSPASAFLSMWSAREEPAPKPDDEGQMVGTEYVLGKVIGYGGFSTVKEAYKVEGTGGTKRLAVKIVKKQVPDKTEKENDEVQAEFDHEVRVWRYLSHPNVLALDSVYETDYATFCFTKLAIGGTLFDLIRQNRSGLDLKLAKKYTYQLACALRYLHEDARVVHRDIKLENCLLDPFDMPDGTKASTLVLCDFGMAEWINSDNEDASSNPYDNAGDRPPPKNIGPSESSTSVAGSLEYASPELLDSKKGIIDPSVDIWAFGVIVFSVIVGSRPFQDAFQPRLISNIRHGKWSQKAVLDNGSDSEVRRDALELIAGCLEMDYRRRWTIRDVLSSRWLREFADDMDDGSDSVWKL
ncbi:hypothetical protein P175DRAFT_0431213 [Aspergillus ochraceoroseus IBT 24754]|uniref:Protein kinase domain-containing protein n=3 Tax=Aspergillus subgen. Nidulantes TaxID=2720870 RepID=A0A0F8XC39_9EURO|nr:uncharacterized protein P175DRAFT_0431213 [Aspergillus ochraceoroseus IBT 24754]KKK15616.1 hypothetical protein AOCH_006886 [Aspergillus ochraceoroseus]KKK21142.1 hypothetical protein ARAM_006524 [Aspergillus rambellii]PTU22681.1 hypothetical protein P175DRAFT_0431213 [Aspergillus ochraceoroseus IBT 24754]